MTHKSGRSLCGREHLIFKTRVCNSKGRCADQIPPGATKEEGYITKDTCEFSFVPLGYQIDLVLVMLICGIGLLVEGLPAELMMCMSSIFAVFQVIDKKTYI